MPQDKHTEVLFVVGVQNFEINIDGLSSSCILAENWLHRLVAWLHRLLTNRTWLHWLLTNRTPIVVKISHHRTLAAVVGAKICTLTLVLEL